MLFFDISLRYIYIFISLYLLNTEIYLYLLYLLKFVRFVVLNSHWCTVQWGVVVYHEEKYNMQICYGVYFILKLTVVLTIY